MNKLILTVAVLFLSQLTMAQDVFKEDVLKVLKASGAGAQMELAKDQVLLNIKEDKKAEFSKDFDASLPSLYDKMANVYMTTYTHEEVKQILKFYNSPVGIKMGEKAAELAKKNMQAGQEWGVELQGLMMKYMQ
jgi:hypothetical protein